jgi:hypothetical protein
MLLEEYGEATLYNIGAQYFVYGNWIWRVNVIKKIKKKNFEHTIVMYANYRIIKLLSRESNYNCRAKIVLHVCSS